MKRSFWKPFLTSTLLVVAMVWLFLVWIPMMQRDNQIDPQQVIRDSQATIDSVRTELQRIQKRNSDHATPKESSDKEPPDTD